MTEQRPPYSAVDIVDQTDKSFVAFQVNIFLLTPSRSALRKLLGSKVLSQNTELISKFSEALWSHKSRLCLVFMNSTFL